MLRKHICQTYKNKDSIFIEKLICKMENAWMKLTWLVDKKWLVDKLLLEYHNFYIYSKGYIKNTFEISFLNLPNIDTLVMRILRPFYGIMMQDMIIDW